MRISDFNREQGTHRPSKGGITRVLPYGGRLRDTPTSTTARNALAISSFRAGAQFPGYFLTRRTIHHQYYPATFQAPQKYAHTPSALLRRSLPQQRRQPGAPSATAIPCLLEYHAALPALCLHHPAGYPSPLDFLSDEYKG